MLDFEVPVPSSHTGHLWLQATFMSQ